MPVRELGGRQILLIRKNMKTMRLAVLPDGSLRVSAPKWVPTAEIERFVREKSGWIDTQQARPRPAAYQWTEGERHPLWGACLPLHLQTPKGARASDGQLAVQKDDPRRALEAFYRQQLLEVSEPLLRQWQAKVGVRANQLRIKRMSTLWGSCNTQEKRVWLNLSLAQYPPACLEMVLVHELCHLLERGHNPRFYRLLGEFLPNWEERTKILEKWKEEYPCL